MTNDHREDIREAAERYTEAALFALAADRDELPHPFTYDDDDPGELCAECGDPRDGHDETLPADYDPEDYADGLAGLLLDADVLTAPDDSDRWRVELSLTVGGPTVYVVADSRWSSVEFHHSWGREANRCACGHVEGSGVPQRHAGRPDGTDGPHTFPDPAPDLHTVSLYGDAAAVWLDIAALCAGVDR